jgi:integrase
MLQVLGRMGMKGRVTVHGFRSTFKVWSSEQTDYPNEVSEMALAHSQGDKTQEAYKRTDLLEKRKPLMENWANYCIECKNVA